MRAEQFALPKFVLAAAHNPTGMLPGTYYYVLFLEQMRKVSRYHRSPGIIRRKVARYAEKYEAGDRAWPEVGRADELRDSPYAVETVAERLRIALWGHE